MFRAHFCLINTDGWMDGMGQWIVYQPLCVSVYVRMSACACFCVLCVLINNVFMPLSVCFLC